MDNVIRKNMSGRLWSGTQIASGLRGCALVHRCISLHECFCVLKGFVESLTGTSRATELFAVLFINKEKIKLCSDGSPGSLIKHEAGKILRGSGERTRPLSLLYSQAPAR